MFIFLDLKQKQTNENKIEVASNMQTNHYTSLDVSSVPQRSEYQLPTTTKVQDTDYEDMSLNNINNNNNNLQSTST